jgi:hypothetical protein
VQTRTGRAGGADGVARAARRRVGAPERAHQCGFGAAFGQGLAGRAQLHQRRQAEDVREQDAFVFLRAARLADGDQEVQAVAELVGRQVDLERERMQVANQPIEDLAQARIGSACVGAAHRIEQGGRVVGGQGGRHGQDRGQSIASS